MKALSFAKHFCIGLSCLPLSMYPIATLAGQNKLADYLYLGEFTKETAKLALQKMPPLDSLQPMYNVSLYKIHYHTPAPDGTMTMASGLVALPVTPAQVPGIVTYMHGTRVTRNDVPSNNAPKNYVYPAVFGCYGGNVVTMPDYLGMGDNNLSLHPYVDAKTLASSSIDMIMATKELADTLHYPLNDKLYLAGYSEGGFTTMVTYEALLKNHPELPVTAAAPGSAPYDWNETTHFITEQPGPRSTLYLAYFFYALQTYGHYWLGLDEVFRAPYHTLIPALFDGTHQPQEIIDALPKDPHDIFQPNFIESIIDGTERHAAELKNNFNHYTFTSTSPLLMVGTKGDHDVPYHGAEIAYEVLKSKSNKVTIKHVSEVLDHLQAFPYVTKEQVEFFQS